MLSTAGPIWDLWNAGGPFLGDDGKPHHRVTVELGWTLQTTVGAVGNLDASKLPVRWFQRQDNSQVETEVPGIKSIRISRSIDQDVATAEITLYNTVMSPQGAAELGNPGYYTYSRGLATTGELRWGHTTNPWLKALAPNALIRTYQGYGGYVDGVPSAIPDLVTSGNLVKTGTWLVDEVRIGTDGTLVLKCRDMAKLVIDQYAYPPMIPPNLYPLRYSRFFQREVDTPYVAYGNAAGNKKWILGIEPDTAGDGYWLVGDDGGVFAFGNSWYYGSLGGEFSHEVTMIARTETGEGYWLVRTNGDVYSFGDAVYHGGQPSPAAPIICIERQENGTGYWLLSNAGHVYAFGGALYHGGNPAGASTIVDMASTKTGLGYWLLDDLGQVYSFGDAVYHGGGSYAGSPFTAMATTPSGNGYWLVDKVGHVDTGGDAVYYGGTSGIVLNDPIQDIAGDPNGRGYWLAASDGGVFTFGAAPGTHFNTPTTSVSLTDSSGSPAGTVTDVTVVDAHHLTFKLAAGLAPDTYQVTVASTYTSGVTLVAEAYTTPLVVGGSPPPPSLGSLTVAPSSLPGQYPDGTKLLVIGAVDGIEPLQFYGSLPGATTGFFPFDGNYLDLADIVKDLLLWAGFWLEGGFDGVTGLPVVYGNIETTGTYVNDPIPISTFDKLPLINGLQKLREIVGYISWADEAGAYHWESPNWFARGNFLPGGTHTTFVPICDELANLQSFGVSVADKDQRSSITVSSSQPYPSGGGPPIPGTITTTSAPASPSTDPIGLDPLRGLVKPALWVNEYFISQAEQQQMAALIALHLWWQQRLGSAQVQGNPCICINDQVGILERQTDESYLHYVRGIDSMADLDSGKWTVTLTTNWLAADIA